ncbi:MAG TPA: TIM-barrel domain-containing protein [Opitutaceae bacterium]
MRPLPLSLASLLLAVAPALALDWTGLQPAGAVTSVTRSDRGVSLACADGSTVHVAVLAPDLVRVRTVFAGQPAQADHSWAIARTDWNVVNFQLHESPEAVVLATEELEVVARRDPLLITFRDAKTQRVLNADERPMARDPKNGRVAAAKKLGLDEHFYGLGEKAARLDKRRGQFVMWNSDTPGYVLGTDPIYQSIPFYLGWENGEAYGLFYDNSHRSTFDLGRTGQDSAGFSAEGGELDYYFFRGPSMKKILGRYTELTGRMPLPPLWALGHQQSRYSYYPDTMVEQVAQQYRDRDLPLDVLHLDIHYMDGYRVFTWDPQRFPDPKGMLDRLSAQGVRVVTIIDPGVKHQPAGGYRVYDEGVARDYFLRREKGDLYIGEVWPGKSVFVDYTKEDARRWWGDLHGTLLDAGVAGIWTDMNEPSDFVDKTGESQIDVVFDDRGARTSYAKNRNLFALNMARATYEGLARQRADQRPFVLTRAGYAGIQRYSATWTGDNNATWDSLALSLPMLQSLGLSGQAFVGGDIGGFIGDADAELLVRWYQVGFLTPFCRNHTAIDSYDHEPWRFGPAYTDIIRRYLKLRYQMLPYLYTTMEEAHRTGVPWFRPLVLEFQTDENTLTLDDQFMAGGSLLVAPILAPRQTERRVYLPAGRWFDYWTGAVHEGGRLIRAEAPLETVPLFVRGGSILPLGPAMNHTGERPVELLRFEIYPDASDRAALSLYEDDGATPAYRDGALRRTSIAYSKIGDGARITIAEAEGGFRPPRRDFEFVLRAAPSLSQVALDGKPLSAVARDTFAAGWWRDEAGALHIRFTDDGRPRVVELR